MLTFILTAVLNWSYCAKNVRFDFSAIMARYLKHTLSAFPLQYMFWPICVTLVPVTKLLSFGSQSNCIISAISMIVKSSSTHSLAVVKGSLVPVKTVSVGPPVCIVKSRSSSILSDSISESVLVCRESRVFKYSSSGIFKVIVSRSRIILNVPDSSIATPKWIAESNMSVSITILFWVSLFNFVRPRALNTSICVMVW